MKNLLKFLLSLLPIKIYNFVVLRPKLKFVDRYTSNHVDWLWRQIYNGIDDRGNAISLLRKNVHIIDKGLQRIDRETSHGIKLREVCSQILRQNVVDDGTLNWSKKVISIYDNFQTSKDISNIVDIPFEKSNIDIEELNQLIKSRRTIRHFSDRIVEDYKLDKILESVNWAANSCNRQNIKLYVIRDKNKIKTCLQLNSGATCMNTPDTFISLCSDTRSYIMPVERDLAYIDSSLGAQNIMLMAHAFGLGTCVLNWSHATRKENELLKSLLNCPDHELIIFNLLIGYPLKGAKTPARKNLTNTVVYLE